MNKIRVHGDGIETVCGKTVQIHVLEFSVIKRILSLNCSKCKELVNNIIQYVPITISCYIELFHEYD